MGRVASYIWGTIAVIAIWWLIALAVNSPALPQPSSVIPEFARNASSIMPAFGISLMRIAIAMAIGTVLGVPLGLWLGLSKRADAVLTPIMYILYPLPKIVLLPILFVLLGIGGESKVVLIAIAVFFQMVVTMRDASHAIPRESIEAMLSFGSGRLRIFKDIVLPTTLPSLFTALRVTTASAVAILFIAESMAGSTGLGYYIMHSWSILEYERMFSGVVAMAIMGILLYEAFDLGERSLTRWKMV